MKKRHLAYSLLIAMLLLSACLARSDRTDKPAPDWSRALYLGGASARQPVALQVDTRGHVHVAWIDEMVRYAHLDEQAHVVYNDALELDLPSLSSPQIVIDGQNQVHLGWMSRRAGQQQLYHALITPDGSAQDVSMVSPEGADVGDFAMYLSPAGEIRLLWTGTTPGGEQGMVDTGLQESTAEILVSGAIDPFVAVDPTGTVHVSWLQSTGLHARKLYYATLGQDTAGSRLTPQDGQLLVTFEIVEGTVYYPPVIGVDDEHVYVLWSEQGMGGGLAPTSAFTRYISFLHGQPKTTNPRPILLPSDSRPEYQTYSSPFGLAHLSLLPLAQAGYNTDFVNAPATIAGRQAELPVALTIKVESQSESRIQVATAVFRDGEMVGYQLAGKTEAASLIPSLATDTGANLHLAWIDTAGFGQYDVYYASLAPAARTWLDRTTSDDVMHKAADILFGVLSGVGLLPIAGIWTFPAMLWVVIFFIASGQEEMNRRPTQIGFVIAVVLYAAAKMLLLPGLFAGTPFLDQIPQHLVTLVGIAIPVLILLIALAVVYWYARRSDRPTIFRTFLLFALVDVALTLVLYAPGFFGRA